MSEEPGLDNVCTEYPFNEFVRFWALYCKWGYVRFEYLYIQVTAHGKTLAVIEHVAVGKR